MIEFQGLKEQQLKGVVDDWSKKLNEHTKIFMSQASEISKWEKQLIENSDQVLNHI